MSALGNYVMIPLLLLGVLIFIHELGHFIVAKLAGVKVECFSLGFGRAVLRRTVGETEYRIAWIPLGGYVKMLGELPGEELPEAEKQRSFGAQPVWRRIAIALAGPAMNLALPVVVIAGMAMTGMPTPTSLIGGVRPDSPAARAGLEAGDRLVAIEDREIWRWEDVVRAVAGNDGEALALGVERDGERRSIEVVPESAPEGRGRVLGIEHWTITAVLGLPGAEGPAARAGLRTGDRVVRVNGRTVDDNYGLTSALASASGVLELEVVRPVDSQEQRIRVRLDEGPGAWSLERLGAVPVDFGIGRVTPGSPAKKAGLEVGDLLLSIDGEPVISFASAAKQIRGSEGEPLALTVLRGGRQLQIEVVARRQPIAGPDGVETGFAIGIEAAPPHVPGEVRDEVVLNPLRALWIGIERTADIFTMTVGGIWQLLTGRVGLENLVGPIGIGKFAGDFFQESGWHPILNLLAVISVNLAILNLLPIPVLDGGQIALALAEVVRGGPISTRTREIAQTLGLSMILVLMGFAFWNDILRHWSDVLGFFKALV